MGYAIGFPKYVIGVILFNPVNMYIFGGTVFAFFDVITLALSDSLAEFTLNYILITFGIPTSFWDAIIQLVGGSVVAGILWLIGSLKYARSRGG